MAGAIPTAPASFTAGERVTAAKLNSLTALANWSTDAPMFHVYLSAAVDLSGSSSVTWSANLSSLSNMSLTLPAAYIPIPYTGIWEVQYQVGVATNVIDTSAFYWYTYLSSDTASTGSRIATGTGHRHTAGTAHYFSTTARVSITAGQYLLARVTSAADGRSLAAGSRDTFFSGRLIARL